MNTAARTVTVDRVDGNIAVLVDDQAQMEIPVSWLPSGAEEGAVLSLQLALDPEAQSDLSQRLSTVMDRLKSRSDDEGDGPIEL